VTVELPPLQTTVGMRELDLEPGWRIQAILEFLGLFSVSFGDGEIGLGRFSIQCHTPGTPATSQRSTSQSDA